jgi:tripartite-type tricarboxylate transporter receptor subunit TctC
VDAVAGQVPVMLTGTGDLLPFVKSGKLRVLATSGATRDVFLPDVPTFKEQGFPNIIAEETIGFYAPAKTPRDIIDTANRAISEALQSAEVIAQLAGIGLAVRASTPEAMSATLVSEHRRWAGLVKRIGFTAES